MINEELLAQLEQLIAWGISGALDWKAQQASDAQFSVSVSAALQGNRPLTADEWAPIHAAAQAGHDALANA